MLLLHLLDRLKNGVQLALHFVQALAGLGQRAAASLDDSLQGLSGLLDGLEGSEAEEDGYSVPYRWIFLGLAAALLVLSALIAASCSITCFSFSALRSASSSKSTPSTRRAPLLAASNEKNPYRQPTSRMDLPLRSAGKTKPKVPDRSSPEVFTPSATVML